MHAGVLVAALILFLARGTALGADAASQPEASQPALELGCAEIDRTSISRCGFDQPCGARVLKALGYDPDFCPQKATPSPKNNKVDTGEAAAPKAKSGRWTCKASCTVQQAEENAVCPERVTGIASGSDEQTACREAKRDATQSTPRGCYPRHCQCPSCAKS